VDEADREPGCARFVRNCEIARWLAASV